VVATTPDLPEVRRPNVCSQPAGPVGSITHRFPDPRFGDYSRTRLESRIAFGGPDERVAARELYEPRG
jgi:hypothetical protein